MNKNEQQIIQMLCEILITKFNADSNPVKDLSFFEEEIHLAPNRELLRSLMESFNGNVLLDKRLEELEKIVISTTKASVERGGLKDKTIVGSKSTWLDIARQHKIRWEADDPETYRDRYFEYLRKFKHRNREQLAKTKASTLRTLQHIGDPLGTTSFSSRGLIIGPVQGGKTEHFNGVVASAFDAGYHLVIVMSGIMEDLRRQTQSRIRNDLLGSSEGGAATGASKVQSFGPQQGSHQINVDPINVLTTSTNDFNANQADGDISLTASKTLIVCKKNGGILKQILVYLEKQAGIGNIDIPVLIIDDEADNASLNNNSHRGETLASLINKRVRAILKMFSKSSYIGYTASPFANILQNREHQRKIDADTFTHKGKYYTFEVCQSLFPKDFIELITPPPTYIGLRQLFDTNEEITKLAPAFGSRITDDLEYFPRRVHKDTENPTINTDRDTRATRKDDPYPIRLSPSLKDAIYCFILTVAIRKTRSKALRDTPFYQPHNTMLIHVSRFILWQTRTRDLVVEFIENVSEKLSHEPHNREGGIYEILERQFDRSFYSSITMGIEDYLPDNYTDDYMSEVSFKDLRPLLASTVSDIECLALNSETKETLIYKDHSPKTYLAIGGNRLARGFTLEGLSVCYFIRDTSFADTLLQMGRWFGYRIGYLDCCKLFMTNDAIEKFDSISRTVEDLENTIDDLSRDPSKTPWDYSLKVASNPGVIKLTRGTILKNARSKTVSFEDHLEQTYRLSVDALTVDAAYSSVTKIIAEVSSHFVLNENKDMLVYRGADSSLARRLLEAERSFTDTNIGDIVQYIQKCNSEGLLTQWTIAIKITGTGAEVKSEDFGFDGRKIKGILRQITTLQEARTDAIRNINDNAIFSVGGTSANITQASDMKIVRSDEALIKAAELKWRIDNPGRKLNYPEKLYRHLMTPQEGVMILYLIDSNGIFTDKKTKKVLPALGAAHKEFSTTHPFIGFVIGTPKINNAPKVVFLEDENISIYQSKPDEDGNEDPTIIDEVIGSLDD